MSEQLAEIERDIRAFADPGSDVLVEKDGAMWEQHGKELRVTFSSSKVSRYPDVVVNHDRFSYAEFFASHYMADLRHLAEFTLRTRQAHPYYIETSARQEDEDGQP